MNPPKVGFNSYVDIATCMVIQDRDYRSLQQSVSDWRESQEPQETVSDWADIGFEINAPDLLKLEWSQRIEEWQRLYPDGGPPVEHCTSLKHLKFGPFFLQHPIAAIALWNVMQTFYALDRFVCCTSKESRDKVAEWESMPPFEYLEASRVEKRWRNSVQNLRKEIRNENNRDVLSPRIDGMLPGIAKLEDACGELRRILKENLKDIKLVDLMLEQISVAAGRRFSMIDTYLKMDEDRNEETSIIDDIEDVTESVDSMYDFRFEKSKISPFEESRIFKPLSRSNSMEIVKHHLVVVWVSTKRGEATLSTVIILLVLLICLYHIQGRLVIIPES